MSRAVDAVQVLNDINSHCGEAKTDEAVDMVMERMEALKDGNTD